MVSGRRSDKHPFDKCKACCHATTFSTMARAALPATLSGGTASPRPRTRHVMTPLPRGRRGPPRALGQANANAERRATTGRPHSAPRRRARQGARRRGRRDDRCRPSLPPPRAAAAWRCGCGSGCGPHPRRARRHRSVSSPSLSSINQKFSTWRSRGQVAASGGCGPWISA